MLLARARAKAALETRRLTTIAALRERYGDDFESFCSLLDIVPKTGQRQQFKLWPAQREFNRKRTGRDIVLKARQVGFTTFEQARDVWFFLTRPGARVTATCQSITDHGPSKNLSANYRIFFDSLRRRGLDLKFQTETATEWVLPDQSRLRIEEAGASKAAAEKKGRSGTVTRLHLTETAFYEYADDTLNALIECVPGPETGSEIVSESTPNGAAGCYFDQCQSARSGESGYTFHFLPWFSHPEYAAAVPDGETIEPRTPREKQLVELGCEPSQLLWFRRKVAQKGQDLTDQEYPTDADTCFLVSGRAFFDAIRTKELLTQCREPIEVVEVRGNGAYGTLRIWHQPVRGQNYVLALDTSEGTGGDRGAGIVFERGTGRHMATLWGQFKPWELARAGAGVGARYNDAEIAVERNNHGHACLRALDIEQSYSPIWYDRDDKPGWNSTQVSRTAALDSLEQAHRGGEWVTHDADVIGEVRTFIINDDGKAEAAPGAHDDLVIASAIGWDVISKPLAARGMGAEQILPF